jgi:hypothetical protein
MHNAEILPGFSVYDRPERVADGYQGAITLFEIVSAIQACKACQLQFDTRNRRAASVWFWKLEWMKILAGLIRLFEASSASERAICEAYTHNSQLQLEANDLGHCAVYEKELHALLADN